MKLIYCGRCMDFVRLTKRLRSCRCGKTKGLYVDNGFGIFQGWPKSFGIGVENPSFRKSILDVKRYGRKTVKERTASAKRKKIMHQTLQHSHFCTYAMVRHETLLPVKKITKAQIERVRKISKAYQEKHGVSW